MQTFRVENASPEQIVDFYAGNLPGWDQVEAPHALGAGSYRGAWRTEGRNLTVSAVSAPTMAGGDNGADVVSQYSLTLGPA